MKSLAKRCLSLALSVGLVGAPFFAASTRAEESGGLRASTDWSAPPTVENPFVPARPGAKPQFSGGAVSGELPVVYRLPPIAPRDADQKVNATDERKEAAELIEQVFTRGLYSVVPREVIWNTAFIGQSSL